MLLCAISLSSDRLRLVQDFAKQYYGKLPLNRSQDRPRRKHDKLADLPSKVGETVLLRARVQTSRPTAKNCFFLLRQKIDTVQAILSVKPGQISKPMFKWGSQLGSESIVIVEGVVEKALQEVKSATISNVEIQITQVSLHTKSTNPENIDDCFLDTPCCRARKTVFQLRRRVEAGKAKRRRRWGTGERRRGETG